MPGRFTLISDPVHGFVTVPDGLVRELMAAPAFQRLRHIRQLGLGFLVFPGAVHTRFEHALGSMALMQEVLATLREKGTPITPAESEAALVAALLHDIGHAPFSHTLEHEIMPAAPGAPPFHHERMSRALMERLNAERGGALDIALAMFDGVYDRPFFNALVASQLDMDRLDYLRRDSFYTGVAEGVVGVERILRTLQVHPTEGGSGSRVVVEEKGIHAVENYLLSRRLMFSQVYLHKTVVAADHLLLSTFARARASRISRRNDPALAATSPSLAYFLDARAPVEVLEYAAGDSAREELLDHFISLDDSDVLYSVKRWTESDDPILADLARRFIERRLPRAVALDEPLTPEELRKWRAAMADQLVRDGRSTPSEADADAAYYVHAGVSSLDAYHAKGDAICVLGRDGGLSELSEASDLLALGATTVDRPYLVRPKELDSDR